MESEPLLGANYEGDRQCSFLVWGPQVEQMELHLVAPQERVIPLTRNSVGYHFARIEGVEPGARYFYRLSESVERPDPASRFQPEGVHAASEVVARQFHWTDENWTGLPLRDYIIYELHVGTFTLEGTFEAILPHLEELRDLGVTALELMPIAQFPGSRNWGYDGVYPFAAQNTYGGPPALKRLVNACHGAGLAVILDVVYNHLGPEGNYFQEFAPYFTDRYRTPWGRALNFDGEHSDEVRRFFLENASFWQTECHLDALRLDAIHAIKDFSATLFLQELSRETRRRAGQLNRRFHLMAESDLNDRRVILPEALGGWGLDAQWSDDFHHSLHTLITNERTGYYEDFGGAGRLAKVLREGFGYTGEYSAYRKRRHGNRPRLNPPEQFVVCSQNHDQIGNRMQGERLSRLASFEGLKLAAGSVLLSPFTPLLFMGEEYGETAPFQYMISHTNPDLVEAVRQGRRDEFSGFAWAGEVPDPQAEATFLRCVLNRDLRASGQAHRALYDFYRELIHLRKTALSLKTANKESLDVRAYEPESLVRLLYRTAPAPLCLLLCFAALPVSVKVDFPAGGWRKLLDSAAKCWTGPGSELPERLAADTPTGLELRLNPKSLALYQLCP